jgi:hypothetical protein
VERPKNSSHFAEANLVSDSHRTQADFTTHGSMRRLRAIPNHFIAIIPHQQQPPRLISAAHLFTFQHAVSKD